MKKFIVENETLWVPRPQPIRFTPDLLGWDIPQDELQYIPEHWLSGFYEPLPLMHYFLGMLYFFFFIIATLGNGLVLWIFTSAKTLRTPSNILVVNLAFCDFIMMLKTPIFIYNSFHLGFAAGPIACKIFAFIGSLSGIGGSFTNACIAFDRYRVITRPFDGHLTTGKAVLLVLLCWTYVIPWAVMPLIEIWGRFVPEGYLTSCSFDYLTRTDNIRYFTITIFIFSYVLPMILIIYFYSQIVTHVINHEKTLKEQAKKMNVDSLRSNPNTNQASAEIRIAKAAITICFLYVAAWTPYAVLALIGAFGDQSLLTPGVTMIPACCCKLVACLDPYVYAISHPRYRLELRKRLPWLCINESEPADNASNATTTSNQNA